MAFDARLLSGVGVMAAVVENGGFARAARALGIPKSRLSRHVQALESRLSVRLVNRSTRRFVVTDVGHEVYRHATAMLAEADAAVEAVEFARALRSRLETEGVTFQAPRFPK